MTTITNTPATATVSVSAAGKTKASKGANTARNLVSQLDLIVEQRKAWEQGAYKTSNDELYKMLGQCLDIYVQLKGREDYKVKERQLLNDRLQAAGLTYKETTPLATKVVRYVFGTDRRRSYTYATTIVSAHEHGIDSVKFPTWVRNAGGVEEVKRKAKSGLSPKDILKQQRDAAEKYFNISTPLVSFASVKELKPSAESTSRFAYALIRTEDDGTASVVYGSNNATVINMLLARAGKDVSNKQAEEGKQTAHRKRKTDRAAAVSKAA